MLDIVNVAVYSAHVYSVLVTWKLFRFSVTQYTFDLDYILDKGDQLLKIIGKVRYLGMEDLPQEFAGKLLYKCDISGK